MSEPNAPTEPNAPQDLTPAETNAPSENTPIQAPSETPETRTLTTPPGGVVTDEVGTISGEVEIWCIDDRRVGIRYVGAAEDYTVTGRIDGRSLDDIVTVLTTDPGLDADGNAMHVSLVRPEN